MTRYTDKFGANVQQILCQATRVVRGKIPAAVRKELMTAVKAGALGRLKKDGLKPEIFYHPDHKYGAIERQLREEDYSKKCIANVVGRDPESSDADELLLHHFGVNYENKM